MARISDVAAEMTDRAKLADAIDPRKLVPDSVMGGCTFIIDNADLIAASDALRAMEWQPIETAPRDGTHIFAGSLPGRWMCSAFFEEHDSQWYVVGSHWTDAHDGTVNPTHWQPLPSPPR